MCERVPAGDVEIFLEVHSPTDVIIVHRNLLTIDRSTVSVRNNATDDVIAFDADAIVERDAPFEWIEIHLQETLQRGQVIKVQMHFSGPIWNDLKGIYYSSYQSDEGETV